MFQEFNDALSELRRKQRHKAQWEQRVTQLTEALQRAQEERDRWEERLQQEQLDVERLTGISLGALFYRIIGKRDEKLTEEEAEVLQAKLQYEEAADTASDLEAELAATKLQLNEVRYVDADIDAVLEEKTKAILEKHPALAASLQALTDREAEEQANVKELQEAAAAGRRVVSALRHAAEQLESAQNWGTFDMLGGGMIATAMKHSRIDDARSAIHAAQTSLRRFQSELEDVQRDVNIRLDIGGLLTFADYFFDGLIADWMVQGRIQSSLEQLAAKRSQLESITAELEAECRKAEARLQDLRSQREAMIEHA